MTFSLTTEIIIGVAMLALIAWAGWEAWKGRDE